MNKIFILIILLYSIVCVIVLCLDFKNFFLEGRSFRSIFNLYNWIEKLTAARFIISAPIALLFAPVHHRWVKNIYFISSLFLIWVMSYQLSSPLVFVYGMTFLFLSVCYLLFLRKVEFNCLAEFLFFWPLLFFKMGKNYVKLIG